PGRAASRRLDRRLREVSIPGLVSDEPTEAIVKPQPKGPIPWLDRSLEGGGLAHLIEQAGVRITPSGLILISLGLAGTLALGACRRGAGVHARRGRRRGPDAADAVARPDAIRAAQEVRGAVSRSARPAVARDSGRARVSDGHGHGRRRIEGAGRTRVPPQLRR